MSDFEKEYYEAPDFWNDGALSAGGDKVRIETTISLIPKEVKSIVDIGCGNGVFLNLLDQKKVDLLGVDRSKEAIKHVRCKSIVGEITSIPLENSSYDCVTCLQVLEHIPVPYYDKAIAELSRASKKYIIVSVPFEEDLESNFSSCPHCKSKFNNDLHVRSYDRETVEQLFRKQGFKCIELKNVVQSKKYLFVEMLLKLKNIFQNKRNNSESFNSPICPICGYSTDNKHKYKPRVSVAENNKGAFKARAISFLEKISPSQIKKGYWIIALFEKEA